MLVQQLLWPGRAPGALDTGRGLGFYVFRYVGRYGSTVAMARKGAWGVGRGAEVGMASNCRGQEGWRMCTSCSPPHALHVDKHPVFLLPTCPLLRSCAGVTHLHDCISLMRLHHIERIHRTHHDLQQRRSQVGRGECTNLCFEECDECKVDDMFFGGPGF